MSAVMSDQSSNNVAEFFSPGPGERLRAARLSMGYDLAKIAHEMHLTVSVVEALEADDFRDIGARVFVRGYLRNYARIVGMPVESVLRQFDEKWPDDTARHTMVRESPTLPADGGPSRGWAGAMTWLLIVGLVVLFLMWWRGYLDEIVPEQIRSTNVVDSMRPGLGMMPAENGSLLPPLDNEPLLTDGSLRLPEVSSDAAPAETEVPESPASWPQEATGAGPDSAVASVAAPETELTPPVEASAPVAVQASVAATEPAAPVDRVAAGTAIPAPAAPADGGAPVVERGKQIVMTFNSACWVDVRDSERKFKLFGEMPKGTRKVLGGQPPYKLVIGNAEAVSISVNGEPFDLAPYSKGNVARFTLDP